MYLTTIILLVGLSQCYSGDATYFSQNIKCDNCKSSYKQKEEINIEIVNAGEKTVCIPIGIKLFSEGKWKILSDTISSSYSLHILESHKKTKIKWENRKFFQKANSANNANESWVTNYDLAEGGKLAFYVYWGNPSKPSGEMMIHEFQLLPAKKKS